MTSDPYRIWLGIPKEIKNPNYYHILGIAQGESNVDVIRSAIEQRRFYIQSKRGKADAAAAKQILDLIEEAAATLLVPEFKHGYDRQIGLHIKSRRRSKAILLPPWMESRIVRVYGEGSGLFAEVFGIVAILFGAFALMAWFSFQLPWQKVTSKDDEATATPLEKTLGESSVAKADSGLSVSPPPSDSNKTKGPNANSGSSMSADQVVGSWREARANTPAGDRVRTFHANGTFTIKMPKLGKSLNGSWRRSGNKVYVNHPDDDGSTPVEDKSFEIVKVDDRLMVIRMDGKRTYEWTRVAAIENKVPASDPFMKDTVWVDGGLKLTVIERNAGRFKAKMETSEWSRIVSGTVQGANVTWLAKDVQPIKGGTGGDNFGAISNDRAGFKMDVQWKQPNGKSGHQTYRLIPQVESFENLASQSSSSSETSGVQSSIQSQLQGRANFESQASSQANKTSSQASQSQGGSIPKPVLYISGESIPANVKMIRQDGDFVAGKIGNAVAFNGKQMSELEAPLPTGNSPRSLACWIKNNRGPIEDKIHVITYGLRENNKPFGIAEASGRWRFFDLNGGLDSEQPVDKNWHHHAVTYDGRLITYYFDSSKVASTERVLSTELGSLVIGGISGQSEFVGIVDELYFFDSALSAGQVRSLFQLKDAK